MILPNRLYDRFLSIKKVIINNFCWILYSHVRNKFFYTCIALSFGKIGWYGTKFVWTVEKLGKIKTKDIFSSVLILPKICAPNFYIRATFKNRLAIVARERKFFYLERCICFIKRNQSVLKWLFKAKKAFWSFCI